MTTTPDPASDPSPKLIYMTPRNPVSVDAAYEWLRTPRHLSDARLVHDLIRTAHKLQQERDDAYRMLNTTLVLDPEEAKRRARVFLVSREVLTTPTPTE